MIRTENLTKSYGTLKALDGIDLQVESGDLYGFIGPNGAGKTTTIRILTTLLEPSAGEAFVNDLSVWEKKNEIRGILGYMPDNFGVYRDMTVSEYLHFFAAAYGIPSRDRKSLVGGVRVIGEDVDRQRDVLGRRHHVGHGGRIGLGGVHGEGQPIELYTVLSAAPHADQVCTGLARLHVHHALRAARG